MDGGQATRESQTVKMKAVAACGLMVPAGYAVQLAEVAERLGTSGARLLADLGLSATKLSEPGAMVSLDLFQELFECAQRQTGQSGIGVHLALSARPSMHGFVGFAAMSASTLREAIELSVRFAPTRVLGIGLSLEVTRQTATLCLEERVPLGAARETLLLGALIGLWRIGVAITGRELSGRGEFGCLEPDYFAEFMALCPPDVQVSFGQSRYRLIFDAALLDLPLVAADLPALRLASERCENELAAISEDLPISARVQALLRRRANEFPTLRAAARSLGMSSRTLTRKLTEQGTSYSRLLEDARRDSALDLIGSALSIEEIASRLGYSDAANFTRAFRRWTARSPRAYAKRLHAERAGLGE